MIDIAQFFPPLEGSNFDLLVGLIAGPMFALCFTNYRIWMWWQVSVQMYNDIYHVMTNGMADKLRPGRNHVLHIMWIGNLVLGLLQIYWWTIILEEAKKVVFGE